MLVKKLTWPKNGSKDSGGEVLCL